MPFEQPASDNDISVSTLFLLRHAEKAGTMQSDPELNNEGKLRAQRLAQMLSDANISAIYSSNFERTKQTVVPLAKQLSLEIELYDPRSDSILTLLRNSRHNAVVVGHSNTIPMMVNSLIGEKRYPMLDENDYSKLFLITKAGEHYTCTLLNF